MFQTNSSVIEKIYKSAAQMLFIAIWGHKLEIMFNDIIEAILDTNNGITLAKN